MAIRTCSCTRDTITSDAWSDEARGLIHGLSALVARQYAKPGSTPSQLAVRMGQAGSDEGDSNVMSLTRRATV